MKDFRYVLLSDIRGQKVQNDGKTFLKPRSLTLPSLRSGMKTTSSLENFFTGLNEEYTILCKIIYKQPIWERSVVKWRK